MAHALTFSDICRISQKMYSRLEKLQSDSLRRFGVRCVLLLLMVISFGVLHGCASSGGSRTQADTPSAPVAGAATSPAAQKTLPDQHLDQQDASAPLAEMKKIREVKALNQKIAMESFATQTGTGSADALPDRENYEVGPGDVLEIAVFQVEKLNRKVRVTGDGYILMPLLGGLHVGGMTTTEIEALLVRELGKNYLRNPHVSVFVAEFQSHQVAVVGAVNKPGIYSIQRPRSVLEMLARAEGLTEKAGTSVQVRRSVSNKETGKIEKETLIMDLKALLMSGDQRLNVVLRGGDSIVVPEAGSVFVEGAVEKPGAYTMLGRVNVLKALSMAGGILFETEPDQIYVYRESVSGERQVFHVDYDKIRENPADDLVLEEGDIVVVHHSSLKRGVASVWKGMVGILSFGL